MKCGEVQGYQLKRLVIWNMLLFLSACYRTFTEFWSHDRSHRVFAGIINLFTTEAPNKEMSISSKNNRILP